MYLIDSHCHLNIILHKNKKYTIRKILKKAYCSHVKLILNVSTSITDYYNNFNKFKKYPNILYSCGIHPLYYKQKKQISKLKNITLNNHRIIAIGETGLDYYHINFNKIIQHQLFVKHIKIGIQMHKPIIIHMRNSEKDILNILSSTELKMCTGVVHSYSSNLDTVRKLLNLGWYISFSGLITFKNAYDIHKIVQFVPINKILIETDSPFLTPVPLRGKINQPSNTFIIAKYISKLKNIDIHTIANETTKNFYKLFHIPYIIKNTII
ncbi:TatD family hydrolase [Buchnera aphidicola]|uniref:TatD family deoxyribonuclease n=1 Tax=Buchnera aphidicola (Stegophylla sp.) TaxID=2315800 RepID=A0A4D6YIZ3_9GAMM|nr:TatD family hydrolase [Buchnera aphidicola (Stegophylla sp.)]QCI26391.1 TatD family deoxyribonuclease [Buchnera aphidicola (Stegophylla sp.)]